MEKPEKLSENGPEWNRYDGYWSCNLVNGQDFLAVLFDTQETGMTRPELDCETGDRMLTRDALDWLRDRIREYRDALNRIDPPSAEWMPVEEVELFDARSYICKEGHSVFGATTYEDGSWVMSDSEENPEPTHILCIAGHPIEAPPVPGGG